MLTMTANDAVRAALGELTEPAEIRDENGIVLGYFTPVTYRERLLYKEARKHFDPAEIQRRKVFQEQEFTTAEVIEHLKSLENR